MAPSISSCPVFTLGGMWQLFLRTSCFFSDGYKLLLLPLGGGEKGVILRGHRIEDLGQKKGDTSGLAGL